MKKTLKKMGFPLLGLFVAIFILGIVLFRNELQTLNSLKKVDDYGMFQMTYYGDYGFDDFLKTGATSDSDIERFVTKRILKGLPIDLGITGAGCTAFVVNNQYGEIIYGRNFDFTYAPSLQIFTDPDDGYASVSTVNLGFAGYNENTLPNGISINSFLTLVAPYLPFDGMNEKGVAIALLAIPEAEAPNDPNKVTLNTTTLIRLVLDKADSVDDAIQLLKSHNIYFSGGVNCHYLVSDATGKSVIVEYYEGDIRVVETNEEYQIASNFIAYNGVNIGEGFTEFDRYNTVEEEIIRNDKVLSNQQAIALLAKIGVLDGDIDKLQWSVLYNLTNGDIELFAHRKIDNIIKSSLKIE